MLATSSPAMSPAYSAYNSVTPVWIPQNGTSCTQAGGCTGARYSITIDGTTTGTCVSFPPKPPCGAAYHMPKALVQVSVNGGTPVGNWYNGPHHAVFSYFTFTYSKVVLLDDTSNFTVSASSAVYCNVLVANIFVRNFLNFEWKFAKTKSLWNNIYIDNPDKSVTCFVSNWCLPPVSPPLCDPSQITDQPLVPVTQQTCSRYYWTGWLAERTKSGGGWTPWSCFPAPLPGQNATSLFGTVDSSLGECTGPRQYYDSLP
jgi:hypothetical protein